MTNIVYGDKAELHIYLTELTSFFGSFDQLFLTASAYIHCML